MNKLPKILILSFLLFFADSWSQKTDSLALDNHLESLYETYRNDEDHSKSQVDQAITLSLEMESTYLLAKTYALKGEVLMLEARYDSAQFYFSKALEIREKNGFMAEAGTTHESIAQLQFKMEEYELGLRHLKQSQLIKEDIGNPAFLMSLYNKLGNGFYFTDRLDSARYYYERSLDLAIGLGDSQVIAASYSCIGDLLFEEDYFPEAVRYYNRSRKVYETNGKWSESIVPIYNVASVYTWQEKYDSSLFYYNLAKERAEETGNNTYMGAIVLSLAEDYGESNQLDSSLNMFQQYITYKDSVFSTENKIALMEAEAKYETETARRTADLERTEKEKIQAQDQNKSYLIYILLSLLALIALMTIYIIGRSRQKRRMNQLELEVKNTEIDTLLKEQEARSYAAMLEGQSKERERVAQDLHDRLGGTLAAVKVQFGAMDQKIDSLKEENKEVFNKVNEMLNDALLDVRRISHDLTSGRVEKLGLKGAISDLMQVLKTAKKYDVEFVFDENLQKLPESTEQSLYAIIQELVSNTLKHAAAKRIDLHLNKQEELLNLVYEDDGIGFDIDLKQNSGLGLSGLRNRVKKEGGEIQFDSVLGRGTIVIINLPL